jgi:hypothetical protein
MVLKTRSWSLLTIPSKSSPREAIMMQIVKEDCQRIRRERLSASRRQQSLQLYVPGRSAKPVLLPYSTLATADAIVEQSKLEIVFWLMRIDPGRMFTSPTYNF